MRRRTTGRVGARTAAVAIVAAVTTIGFTEAASADTPAPTAYTVAAGDTLSAIARHTGVPASAIASTNSLTEPDRLRVGMRLRIPPAPSRPVASTPSQAKPTEAATAAKKPKAKPKAEPKLKPGRYVVQTGDTVIGLARRSGVAPRAIIAANGLAAPAYAIRAGASITIPSGTSGKRSGGPGPSAPETRGGPVAGSGYRVRRGDTVVGLASRAGVSAGAIIAANRLAPPSFRIREGQTLQIPPRGTKAMPAPGVPSPGVGRYPSTAQVGAALDANARRYGLPPDLVKGVAWQESSWRQQSVSNVGAVGVMQLMPATARWIGDKLLRRRIDSGNYLDNIQGGTAYLDYLLGQVGGNERLGLASYYQGLGSVRKRGLLPESETYVARIQGHRKRFR